MERGACDLGTMSQDWVPPTNAALHHRITGCDEVACKRFFDKWYESWKHGHLPQSGGGATDIGWEDLRTVLWTRQLTLKQVDGLSQRLCAYFRLQRVRSVLQVRNQLKRYKSTRYPSLAASASNIRLPQVTPTTTKTKLVERVGDFDTLTEDIFASMEADASLTLAPTSAWAKECVDNPALRTWLKKITVEHCLFLTELLVLLHSSKTQTITAQERAFEASRFDLRCRHAAECFVMADWTLVPRSANASLTRMCCEELWKVLRQQVESVPGRHRLTPLGIVLRLQVIAHEKWCKRICGSRKLSSDLPQDPETEGRPETGNRWWYVWSARQPDRAAVVYYVGGYLLLSLKRTAGKPRNRQYAAKLQAWIESNQVTEQAAVAYGLPTAKASGHGYRSQKAGLPAIFAGPKLFALVIYWEMCFQSMMTMDRVLSTGSGNLVDEIQECILEAPATHRLIALTAPIGVQSPEFLQYLAKSLLTTFGPYACQSEIVYIYVK